MEAIEKHFKKLSAMLLEIGVPQWDEVLVTEGLYIDSNKKQKVLKLKTFNLEDYSDRFDKLMSDGYSWLNFCGLGLLENNLVISLELPKSRVGSHFTSVNLAGPARFVCENGYNLEQFIEIIE